MARQLPVHVSREDVLGAACLGLAEALARYDRSPEDSFEGYALQRARGAIADHLRTIDAVSRRARIQLARMERAGRTLESRFSRMPTADEIAAEVRITATECANLLVAAESRNPLSLVDEEGLSPGDSGATRCTAETLLADKQDLERMVTVRGKLASRMQAVLALYYEAELPQREIARRLGISEARVSQLRKEAIALLRSGAAEARGLPRQVSSRPL